MSDKRTENTLPTAPAWQVLDMRHNAVVERLVAKIDQQADAAVEQNGICSTDHFVLEIVEAMVHYLNGQIQASDDYVPPQTTPAEEFFAQTILPGIRDSARNRYEQDRLLGMLFGVLAPAFTRISDREYESWCWYHKREVFGVADPTEEIPYDPETFRKS